MADPRTLARVRMFGWRNYQPTPYFAVSQTLIPAAISAFSYLVDTLDNRLTDGFGNELIVND